MPFCNKCSGYTLAGDCHCRSFTITDEDGEEYKIQAINAHDAALKYAEKSNTEGDYYLMNESIEIEVDGEKYRISAEPDVYYSADEVAPDQA